MRAMQLTSEKGQRLFVELSDGVEVAAGAAEGASIAGGDGAQETIERLRDVGDAIADVCRTLQQQVQQSLGEAKPSELTLAFGIKLAGEAGVPLVTKGSVEGTFQITAKWDFSGISSPSKLRSR